MNLRITIKLRWATLKNPYSGLKNIPKNIWMLSIATLINRAGTMVLPFIALYANQELIASKGDAGSCTCFLWNWCIYHSTFCRKAER